MSSYAQLANHQLSVNINTLLQRSSNVTVTVPLDHCSFVRDREKKGARGQTGALQQAWKSRKERGNIIRELVKLKSSGVYKISALQSSYRSTQSDTSKTIFKIF